MQVGVLAALTATYTFYVNRLAHGLPQRPFPVLVNNQWCASMEATGRSSPTLCQARTVGWIKSVPSELESLDHAKDSRRFYVDVLD